MRSLFIHIAHVTLGLLLVGRGALRLLAAGLDDAAHNQGKGLLNVDHFASTRLHEAARVGASPLESDGCPDLALVVEVALVAGDEADWRDCAAVKTLLRLHVYEGSKVVEGSDGGLVSDVVDEQEGVGLERACCP